MKSERFQRIRARWKNRKLRRDLFKRIRVRLTLTYSAMLILMLLLFSLIVTGVLTAVIAQEQIRQLQDQADEEVALYRDALHGLPEGGDMLPDVREESGTEGTHFFTYIVNAGGRLVAASEQEPGLRDAVLQRVRGWQPVAGDIRLANLGQGYGQGRQLILAGRSQVQDGQLTGVLYTGIDVSFYWKVLGWVARVFLALVALFGLVSAVVGQRMAARAMVPIRSAYQKQQHFVADASHELRTPLAVLRSSIDVIDLEDGDTLSDMSKRVLSDMKEEVQSMSRLVADLLTLARSDSGAVELEIAEFDPVPVAEQLIRSRQGLAEEKEIRLSLDARARLSMRGDQERVKQLLAILVDNALAYTPSGGRVTVSVGAERSGFGTLRAVVLEVRDTGIGIAAEEQERIFERFYRVEEARTRAAGGTGIGLALAKWIVGAHRGTIRVQSAPGAGSTFIVRFPIRKI